MAPISASSVRRSSSRRWPSPYGDRGGGDLPGTAEFGAWENFGPVASSIPTSADLTPGSGTGQLRGNDGIHDVVDQQVYRIPGTDDGAVGIFARLSGEPGDRNLTSFYAGAGVTAKGLVPRRPDDTAGLSLAAMQVSPAARPLGRAERAALGVPYPIRSNALLFEATYPAQVAPDFTLQPDLQGVARAGGGVPHPFRADHRPIADALVLGLRATIAYRGGASSARPRPSAAVRSAGVFAPPRSSHTFGSSCDCRLTKR